MKWVHLDLKGMIPSPAVFRDWLARLAAGGADGVVIEYEDRLPWQSLPGVYRAGYSLEEWRATWAFCREQRLRLAPLVQTQGHLEWLLKRPAYAGLRENGHWNELCPCRPAATELVFSLLDEAIDLHPDSAYIHLGADETWNLAACPDCRRRAARSPHGRFGVYLDHVGALCRHVVSRGRRPMIWADMFWRTGNFAVGELPLETVLVDWHYGGGGPWPSLEKLRAAGHEVWGGSAIRSGYDQKYALAPLGMRIENVLAWERLREDGAVAAVLHTVWGRSNSLRPVYGPWEPWLPAFLAAGDPCRWRHQPLADLVPAVDRAMIAPEWEDTRPLQKQLEDFPAADTVTRDCLDWWALALAHRRLLQGAVEVAVGHAGLAVVGRAVGQDPAYRRTQRQQRARLAGEADAWREKAGAWLAARGYGDRDEYLDSRLAGIGHCLRE